MHMLRAAAPLLGLSLVLAACSSGGGASPSAAAPTAAASVAAPSAPASAPASAAAGVTVNLADSSLGKILADASGKTLYAFAPDAADKSACTANCADNWPPLTGTATAGTGLDASKFTTLKRDDGSSQVVFNGHPLYYFAGDKAAGDTNGEGVGGKWYVIGADGNTIQGAAASPAASAGASASAGGVSVALASTKLGKVLVAGDKGMTVYLFTPDTKSKSACTADCATNWPPVTSDAAPTLGKGLDAEDFGTLTRDDGTKQVTFYGHPLYFFAGDKAAGDTTGQGLFSKWYVVDSEGNAMK